MKLADKLFEKAKIWSRRNSPSS